MPSPNVAEDHQTKNAMALVERNAAEMVTDAEASEKLIDTILSLFGNENRLSDMSANILNMAMPKSDEKIVDEIVKLIEK